MKIALSQNVSGGESGNEARYEKCIPWLICCTFPTVANLFIPHASCMWYEVQQISHALILVLVTCAFHVINVLIILDLAR